MLKVTINSFSYKKGLRVDDSGNGGGFVFDCRCLPNPYKYEDYRFYSGLDPEIKYFFSSKPIVEVFASNILKIISIAIENYIDRDFDNLSINFGCTGGQHRSVYLANLVNDFIKSNYKVETELNHFEKNNWVLK